MESGNFKSKGFMDCTKLSDRGFMDCANKSVGESKDFNNTSHRGSNRIANLSNRDFSESFKRIVQTERRITAEVLVYFREAEKRMLFAELGYPSLMAFAVQELKYSEAAAYRRIAAMRMTRDLPEVKEKIESGELSLSTVTQASTFFRQSEKQQNEKMGISAKRDVLKAIAGKSSRETQSTLVQLNPEFKPEIAEKHRPLADGGNLVTMTLDAVLLAQLEEIQVLLGKKMQLRELLKYLAREKLVHLRNKSQRMAKAAEKKSTQISSNTITESREKSSIHLAGSNEKDSNEIVELIGKTSHAIKESTAKVSRTRKKAFRNNVGAKLRREILNRAGYQCCYTDSSTARRCEQRYGLQIEHKVPISRGGSDSPENLEILCSVHNKLRAVQKLGLGKMKRYIPSLR